MTSRIPDYFQLDEYNITPQDVVAGYLRCEPEAIHPNVIITPVWNTGFIDQFPGVTTVSDGRVYEVRHRDQAISVIRSGIGAPLTGDVVLALGCTPCRRLVFTGSVGGLDPAMKIGDLLVVDRSVCGEGFSRYLSDGVSATDRFLEIAEPDAGLTKSVRRNAHTVSEKEIIPLHEGTVFSSDTILAQFFRMQDMVSRLHCFGIEMETSATFNAARLVGIQTAALLQVSDMPLAGKSLFSGRTAEENERRRLIRRTALPEILLDTLMTPPVA